MLYYKRMPHITPEVIGAKLILRGIHLNLTDNAMKELAKKPRQGEWEAYVSRFQQSSEEATADEKWQLMERIYKLD